MVRDRPCFWAPAAELPWDTGAGPGLFAEVAMSGWPLLRPLAERWLFRRCGCEADSVRDAVGGLSLLSLRLDCWRAAATFVVSLAYSSWGRISWAGRPEDEACRLPW